MLFESWTHRLTHRVRLLFRHARAERDMDAEMRGHIEEEAAELMRSGMTAEEAHRAARVAFGGVERFKEEGRSARGNRSLEEFLADIRFAARMLRRNPGFAATAVSTFALGLGAATAIFSVVRGVLLAPLPYQNPQELVAVWERRTSSEKNNVVAVANFEAWHARSHAFAGMAALIPAPSNIATDDGVERVAGVQVSPGYFHLLGASPALGHEFTDADIASGHANVAVLSDQYWRRHFASDSAVVGKTLIVDGKPITVIGVMPATFEPPRFGWIDEQALWFPFVASAENRAWGHVLHVVARLRSGVTLDVANAELAGLGRSLATEIPEHRDVTIAAIPLAATMTGDVRTPLLLLLGAVGVLLLMAIGNVATLTLGMTRQRAHEFALRRAIGASAHRLTRQLFTESALLGLAGCAVGLGVAAVGVRVLVALMPVGVPRADTIRLDPSVLVAALIATLAATIGFGTAAAFQGSARDAARDALAGTTRSRVTGRSGAGALVTFEIALALVLSVLAGLMIRSFANLRSVDLGFTPDQVVAGRIALNADRYGSPEAQRAFFDRLDAALRTTPGVQSAAVITVRPFRGGAPTTHVTDPAHPPVSDLDLPMVDIRFADSTLFATLGIPILSGAPLSGHENPSGPPHVVVDQALLRALNLRGNPVGQTVHVVLNGGIDAEIVGVAGDAHLANPRTPPRATAYLSADRFPDRVNDVVVRGDIGPAALGQALHRAAAEIDPMVPVYDVAPLRAIVDNALARDRFTTFLLAAFSIVALLLASVGVYGVCAADVGRRKAEIGIRRALGAGTAGILGIVLRRAAARTALGTLLGIVAALAVTRSIASLLFGVAATDVASFASVAAIMLGTAAIAAFVPAWRATRVSPLSAIRSE